jgi:hypothetical protein
MITMYCVKTKERRTLASLGEAEEEVPRGKKKVRENLV